MAPRLHLLTVLGYYGSRCCFSALPDWLKIVRDRSIEFPAPVETILHFSIVHFEQVNSVRSLWEACCCYSRGGGAHAHVWGDREKRLPPPRGLSLPLSQKYDSICCCVEVLTFPPPSVTASSCRTSIYKQGNSVQSERNSNGVPMGSGERGEL